MKTYTQKYYIYRITNLINGKTYIGQRKCKTKRPETDTYMGSGLYIKRAENKYGLENFKKEILAISPTKKMTDFLEKAFIASERQIKGRENCYNIAEGGQGCNGVHPSAETRAKMSIAHKGKKHRKFSAETRAKMSLVQKDKWKDAKYKAKMSYAARHRSIEARTNISAAQKGKYVSDETRAKLSAMRKGKKFSEEHKRNMSIAQKGKHHNLSDEQRAKMSTFHKGKHWCLDENGKRKWVN